MYFIEADSNHPLASLLVCICFVSYVCSHSWQCRLRLSALFGGAPQVPPRLGGPRRGYQECALAMFLQMAASQKMRSRLVKRRRSPPFHACCWEPFYIFAYGGLVVEIPTELLKVKLLLPFQRQPSFSVTFLLVSYLPPCDSPQRAPRIFGRRETPRSDWRWPFAGLSG